MRTVLDGLVMGESVRWHDECVWFCDWGAGEVIRVAEDKPEVVARMAEGPFCIDWLPGGSLLIVDGPGARLLRDGQLFADLGGIDRAHPWNDIATDSRGNVFVNNIGYEFGVEQPAPGLLAVVTPDGTARQVADELLFPNGMAVTADSTTLIVAESHAGRLTAFDIAPDGGLSNRRIWAEVDGSAPDGVCLDSSGAVWYADVPNRQCVRVREGGEILATLPFDLGAFDCVLSGDGGTLYAVVADYSALFTGRTGRLMATPV
ncbi:MAG: SMP-30/gluconolactonase/LRE family protein [Actinoplanes sp.]